jgi:hypothetical protein
VTRPALVATPPHNASDVLTSVCARVPLADHGIEHRYSWRDHDEDYATADFIAVPAPPWRLCGFIGAYGVVQVEPR